MAALVAHANLNPNTTCCRCGGLLDAGQGGWTADHHPTPRSQGGTNLEPAHAHCNYAARDTNTHNLDNTGETTPPAP